MYQKACRLLTLWAAGRAGCATVGRGGVLLLNGSVGVVGWGPLGVGGWSLLGEGSWGLVGVCGCGAGGFVSLHFLSSNQATNGKIHAPPSTSDARGGALA